MSNYAGMAEGAIDDGLGLYFGLQSIDQAGKTAPLRNFSNEVGGMPINQYIGQLGQIGNQQFGWDNQMANTDLSLYPQFSAAATKGQTATAQAALNLYPQAAVGEQNATNWQRRSDVRDLGRYGGSYAAALGSASPGYNALQSLISGAGSASPLLGKLNSDAMGAGQSPLYQMSQASAMDQLGLGSSLSPQQARDAMQTSSAGYADRGMLFSNPSVSANVIARDAYGQNLLQQRQSYANSVWGLGTSEDQARRGFQSNVQQLNTSDAAQRAQQVLGAEGAQVSPILNWAGSRTSVNPWGATQAFGYAPSVGAPAQVMGAAPQVTQASAAVQPLYSYGQDLYNTDFNAQQAAILNKANAYAALSGGFLSQGGQVMGSGGGASPGGSPGGGSPGGGMGG